MSLTYREAYSSLMKPASDMCIVYDDDTSIIPRSTTVIAKRLPPIKPGRGGAARYVSGKMPQNAKNSHRSEVPVSKVASAAPALTVINGAQTEEQKLAVVFKMGADQWAQQQQEMAKFVFTSICTKHPITDTEYRSATPVQRSGPSKGKPANVPDHPPPPGYICYRCGEKGHWIQVCPTNDDPAYENRPRVKRTTGIPRSFLKTVEKPTTLANDGTMDDTKQPAGVMVNAEGEWVIAEPDKAAWDQYQAKAKVSAAAQEAAKQGSKELQDRGLECSIDKRLFVDPTKTPCCQRTFCHDCITNALLENDLRCPECSTESILIDDLTSDKDMNAKICSYEEEKSIAQAREKDSKSPTGGLRKASKSPPASNSSKPSSPTGIQLPKGNPKKRPAESELVNERTAPGRKEKAPEKPSIDSNKTEPFKQSLVAAANTPANQQLPYSNGNYLAPQGMVFPTMTNFMPMAMTMDPSMGTSPAFQNPLIPNGSFMGMWGGGYQQQPMMPNGVYSQHNHFMSMNGMNGVNGVNGMNGMNGMNGTNGTNGMNGMNMNGMGMTGRGMNGQGRGSFANQQRTTFSATSMNDEDSAYFRKPVNPHRHQARRNVQRPTDYREI